MKNIYLILLLFLLSCEYNLGLDSRDPITIAIIEIDDSSDLAFAMERKFAYDEKIIYYPGCSYNVLITEYELFIDIFTEYSNTSIIKSDYSDIYEISRVISGIILFDYPY